MNEIWLDIKQRFEKGDILTKLIFVNGGMFIITVLFGIIWGLATGENFTDGTGVLDYWLALPTNNLPGFIVKPYTLITHIFMHADFFHVFFNMMLLFFMGRMFLNYFSPKQLFGLFMMGGIIGGIALLIITNLSPFFKVPGAAVGASAAIMAIAIAVVSYTPNTVVQLFGVFPVKLMWIGLFFVASDLVYFYDQNTGGHLAHLFGAGVGYWYSASFKQGKDITSGINKVIGALAGIFKPKPKMKVVYSQEKVRKMSDEDYNVHQKVSQAEIDAILDKISASGYSSLTKREKDILFQYSNKK